MTSLLALAALASLSIACGAQVHTTCVGPTDDGGRARDSVVEGHTMPWDGVQVRFLGLSHIGQPGSDGEVELRWRITHREDLRALEVSPTFSTRGAVADVVEQEVVRGRGVIDVRVRMAMPIRSRVPGIMVGVTVGIRLVEVRTGYPTWVIPPRTILILGGGDLRAFNPTYDGTLEVELVASPFFDERGGTPILRAGVTYELRYRVHNRTSDERQVHIAILGDQARFDGPGERDVTIAGGGSVDVPVALHFDEAGTCDVCLSFFVRFSGHDGWVDGFIHSMEVER